MNKMLLSFVLSVICLNGLLVAGYPSFAGSNLYYAPGLYQQQQDFLFSNLQSAGVKVVRVWLGITQM